MKKTKLNCCYLLISLFLLLLFCAPSGQLQKNSLALSPGSTKEDVVKALGTPQNRQFQGLDEAWQYCETDYSGFSGDNMLVVWLYDGKVTGIQTYKNYLLGNCKDGFKEVKWESAPSRIIETRKR
jgi:hypothetical protein